MRHIVIICLMLTTLPGIAHAETIRAQVNGLVCSFCASGIEKTFKAQPTVDQVKVDLDSKLVTINTKPNQTIDDTTVTRLIMDAGYSVVGIERTK